MTGESKYTGIRIRKDTKAKLDGVRLNGQSRSGVIEDLIAVYSEALIVLALDEHKHSGEQCNAKPS